MKFRRSAGGVRTVGPAMMGKLAQSRVTAQGQVSLPSRVRNAFGITPGSVIEWSEEDGRLVVRRAGLYSSEDIFHRLFPGRPPKRRSDEELKEAARRHARRKYAGH